MLDIYRVAKPLPATDTKVNSCFSIYWSGEIIAQKMIYSCNDCKIFRAQIPRKFFEGVASGGYLLSHEVAR